MTLEVLRGDMLTQEEVDALVADIVARGADVVRWEGRE